MGCETPPMDLEACGMRPGPNLKDVERFIDVNVSEPIDLSQMRVLEVSVMPKPTEDDRFKYFERKALMGTIVLNEHGEQEELLIEFTLKSKYYPRLKPDEKQNDH